MPKTSRAGGTNARATGHVLTRPSGAPRSQRKPKQTGDSVYDGWKVDKLRDELRGRELPTTGKKTELVARLLESDAADGAGEFRPDPEGGEAPDDAGDQDADDGGGESEPA